VSDQNNTLDTFKDKDFRDGFMQTIVRSRIAYQLRHIRESFGLSQSQLAKKIGTSQSVVSRLESTDYGRMTVQTLLDVASSLDIALSVRFVSYPEFLNTDADLSEEALKTETIHQSVEAKAEKNDSSTYPSLLVRRANTYENHSFKLKPQPKRQRDPYRIGPTPEQMTAEPTVIQRLH